MQLLDENGNPLGPGHDPQIHPKSLREQMQELAEVLAKGFAPQGFALFVFDLNAGPEGRMNYISNADRQDIARALRRFLRLNEKVMKRERGKR